MNQFEEIKKHNLQKALLIETSVVIEEEKFIQAVEEVVDTLNKSFIDGLATEEETENDFKNLDFVIEKARSHKYYKREGAPGHYKYFYTKEQYDSAKRGSAGEETKKEKDSPGKEDEGGKVLVTLDNGKKVYKDKPANDPVYENFTPEDHHMAARLLWGKHREKVPMSYHIGSPEKKTVYYKLSNEHFEEFKRKKIEQDNADEEALKQIANNIKNVSDEELKDFRGLHERLGNEDVLKVIDKEMEKRKSGSKKEGGSKDATKDSPDTNKKKVR